MTESADWTPDFGGISVPPPPWAARRPVRMAIQAQGPTSRSESLELCVDNPGLNSGTNVCDKHVATNSALLNTAPGVPADYNGVILDWVTDRRSDD